MAGTRKLGKPTDQRMAMLNTLVTDLVKNGKVVTTEPRAKEVKAMADSIIALAVKEHKNFEEVNVKVSKAKIDSNGRKVKTLSRHWIGDMYIIKLKQSDRRGFSGRSTGTIDIKGLPTRSFKSKNHMEKHSDSAIRFGESETLNFSIGVPSEDIALFNSLYRTSIKGREQLVKSMFNFDGKDNKNKVKIDTAYTSRVAEIFNVFFKSLGLEIDYVDDDDVLRGYDDTEIKLHTTKNGETLLCTDYQFFLKERYEEIKEEILKENIIMTDEQLRSEIEARLKERRFINGPLYDEDGTLLFE